MALLAARGNDLETPATAVVPELKAVMTALSGLAGVEISRLSGAGPTCFGIFASEAAAAAGAADLKAAHPGWWVEATRLPEAPARPPQFSQSATFECPSLNAGLCQRRHAGWASSHGGWCKFIGYDLLVQA